MGLASKPSARGFALVLGTTLSLPTYSSPGDRSRADGPAGGKSSCDLARALVQAEFASIGS